jgi:hypothetical protein
MRIPKGLRRGFSVPLKFLSLVGLEEEMKGRGEEGALNPKPREKKGQTHLPASWYFDHTGGFFNFLLSSLAAIF